VRSKSENSIKSDMKRQLEKETEFEKGIREQRSGIGS